MESGMLFLMGLHGEWTYARLTSFESVDDDLEITCIPAQNDAVLQTILSGYFAAFGLACEEMACHASLMESGLLQVNGRELLRIRCRRVGMKRALNVIAEKKVEQFDEEWDKPFRTLGTHDGMMGFASALSVRPGFVTLVNQIAWRILFGRDMPFEYGQKGRVSRFNDADGTADPNIQKLLETPCPFKLLYPTLGHNPDQFAALSKLYAKYLLMDRGVVDFTNEFTIEAGPDDRLRVSFKGSRAGISANDLPIHVFVQGTCQLEAREPES